MNFEEFRRQKKFKAKDDSEIFMQDEEDFEAMSEFEKEVVNGRFLLEKKQKLKLQN